MKLNETHTAPYPTCLHPRKITNSRGEVLLVPCGRCKACQLNKGAMYTTLCNLESQNYGRTFFVTLTYDDDYIPRVWYKPNAENLLIDFYLYRRKFVKTDLEDVQEVDEQTGEITISPIATKTFELPLYATASFSSDPLGEYLEKLEVLKAEKFDNDMIPVLYKKDLQRFLKRLRFNLKNRYGKMRYYAVGEYGPKHYRPHYHMLLWFEQEPTFDKVVSTTTHGRKREFETNALLDEVVRKSWQYGRTCTEISRGDSAAYTAGYTTSFSLVPDVLRQAAFKPFCAHSSGLGRSFFDDYKATIYETLDFRGLVTRVGGEYREIMPSSGIKAAFFPRCFGFDIISDEMRRSLYVLYDSVQKIYPYWRVSSLTRSIFSDIQDSLYFAEKASAETIYKLETEDETALVIIDGEDSSLMVNQLTCLPTDRYSIRNFFIKYAHYNGLNVLCNSEHAQALYDFISRCLYTSKHFIEFCCENDLSNVDFMIQRIEMFYSKQELLRLSGFLQYQDLILSDFRPEEQDMLLKSMYDDSFEFDDYKETSIYNFLRNQTSTNFDRRIKHKKVNDLNKRYNNL